MQCAIDALMAMKLVTHWNPTNMQSAKMRKQRCQTPRTTARSRSHETAASAPENMHVNRGLPPRVNSPIPLNFPSSIGTAPENWLLSR